MHRHVRTPVLFFDFDNTIAKSDVLDAVIERFSITNAWREIEGAWQAGRISAQECLRLQIGDLRVSAEALENFAATVPIDPHFSKIVAWADGSGVELSIVSDNVSMLVRAILSRSGLPGLPVYANELEFDGDRPKILFPLLDPNCARCAHCKAQHLRQHVGRTRIYVGDGLSDICPALVADVVFAKDSLAAHLERIGQPYRPFRSLADVLEYLESSYGTVLLEREVLPAGIAWG